MIEESAIYDKCVGVLFNKVNTEKLRLYNSSAAKSYYYSRYSNYYVKSNKQKARAATNQGKMKFLSFDLITFFSGASQRRCYGERFKLLAW